MRVRDFGRGIPLGKLVECVSRINTGGKYNDDVFQYSVGLNGVGLEGGQRALLAASRSRAGARGSYREGEVRATAILVTQKKGRRARARPNGTLIVLPARRRPILLGAYRLRTRQVHPTTGCSYYAYLNSGLSLVYNGEERFYSKSLGGLARPPRSDELGDERAAVRHHVPLPRRTQMEFAFTHTHSYGEKLLLSFVNGQFTNDGGTHQSAFREGILKGVNEFAGSRPSNGEDVRDGIVGAIAIKLKRSRLREPDEEQARQHGHPFSELVKNIREQGRGVALHMQKFPQRGRGSARQDLKSNERVAQGARRTSRRQAKRARAKKVSILQIPQAHATARYHLGDPRTRARASSSARSPRSSSSRDDSAGGTMVQLPRRPHPGRLLHAWQAAQRATGSPPGDTVYKQRGALQHHAAPSASRTASRACATSKVDDRHGRRRRRHAHIRNCSC